jgi:hypothetical protein
VTYAQVHHNRSADGLHLIPDITDKRIEILCSKRAKENKNCLLDVCARGLPYKCCPSKYFSLNEEMESLSAKRLDLLKLLYTHRKFNVYVNSVLEATDDFSEAGDILARHRTLYATYQVKRRYRTIR